MRIRKYAFMDAHMRTYVRTCTHRDYGIFKHYNYRKNPIIPKRCIRL